AGSRGAPLWHDAEGKKTQVLRNRRGRKERPPTAPSFRLIAARCSPAVARDLHSCHNLRSATAIAVAGVLPVHHLGYAPGRLLPSPSEDTDRQASETDLHFSEPRAVFCPHIDIGQPAHEPS